MALTFAVPDSVLSTTLSNYKKQMTDNIFKATPLYEKLYRDGKVRKISGGESIVIPQLSVL